MSKNETCDWCEEAEATKTASYNGPTPDRHYCWDCYKQLHAV